MLERLIILLASSFLIFSCSSDEPEDPNKEGARELFVHGEKEKDGTETITKVIEEVDGDKRIIRVQKIRKGRIEETVHHLESDSFELKIPVSDRPDTIAGGGLDNPNADILVYNQQLEIAREKMIKAQYEEALKALDKAERIDPKSARVHMMKGSVFYAQGFEDKAKKEYQTALRLDPENKEVLKFLDYLKVREDANKPQFKVE